jgi:hypothetical protein
MRMTVQLLQGSGHLRWAGVARTTTKKAKDLPQLKKGTAGHFHGQQVRSQVS